MAVVIAGVSAYILGKSKKWALTAPRTVAGMSRDTSAAAQLAFGGTVTKFRADLTRLPGYGRLTSTVSGVYTLGPDRDVGFIGFNGAFNVQVMLKSANGFRVQNVSPGPHGGTAECGVSGSAAICQWSTGTTVGIVLLLPGGGTGTESVTAAGDLMIKVRDSVEQPAR